MGESGDQLQRTGSATPSPAQALTTEKIKTCKQAVPLYWQGHVFFCFSIHVMFTDVLRKFQQSRENEGRDSVQPQDAFMTMIGPSQKKG